LGVVDDPLYQANQRIDTSQRHQQNVVTRNSHFDAFQSLLINGG